MSHRTHRSCPLLRLAGVITIVSGLGAAFAQEPPVVEAPEPIVGVPEIPATPLAALDVILVRPFTLAQAYEDDWRLERPLVRGGLLMVVDLPPDAVFPRQVAEPVLLVGGRVAERLHVAWPHGRAVIIVPTEVDDEGTVVADLSVERIFFGSPELPERVDAEWIKAELVAAETAGIPPIPADRIDLATRRGGRSLALADRRALLGAAALLIGEFIPDQAEAAEALLLNALAGE